MDSIDPIPKTSLPVTEPVNPYASSQISHVPRVPRPASEKPITFASIWKTVLVWTGICTLSAAPSFFWGFLSVASHQAVAMLVGVVIFIALYTGGDLYTRNKAFRKNHRIRNIIRATFIIRCLMVVVVPVALYLDLFIGFGSVAIVAFLSAPITTELANRQMGFGLALLTTLVQGTLLSGLLVLVGLIVTALVGAVRMLAGSSQA